MTRVQVSTGARLHFGLLAVRPRLGRAFGGIGLMIDRPGFTVRGEWADKDEVFAPDETTSRLMEFRDRCRKALSGYDEQRPVRLEICSTIPFHSGLGSGTQLAMAVALVLAKLYGHTNPSPMELARWVSRGKRSAIGIHGFATGGLLIDAGQRFDADRQLGTIATRLPFPTEWPIVLLLPESEQGLHGPEEQRVFVEMPGMPQETTAELCRITLMELMPAVREGAGRLVQSALQRFGDLVGDFFSVVQGGRYAHPQMASLAVQLRAAGPWCVVQSSWGPAIAVICLDDHEAAEVQAIAARQSYESPITSCVCRASNTGANLTTL